LLHHYHFRKGFSLITYSYNCIAPELMEARFRARRLTTKYNTQFPDDATMESLQADRNRIVNELIGSVGSDSYIEPPFYVDYGCNIRLGDRFYANFKYAPPSSLESFKTGRLLTSPLAW
jgi:hypothetical protein